MINNRVIIINNIILYNKKMVFLPLMAGMIGFAASEIIIYYWKKNHQSKVYFFDRRIHHGEIGVILLCILSMGRISPLLSSFIIGCGLGLINDDMKDLKKWFRFHKR
jgi:hypothetical protein